MNDPESLATALPKLMVKVRDEFIPAYESIGPAGHIAVALMKIDLDRATVAMATGDLPGMIAAYKELLAYKL